jgi:hypothetical protein
MNIISRESLLHVAFTSNAIAQQPPLIDATSCTISAQQSMNKPLSLLSLTRNKLHNRHATNSQKGEQQALKKQSQEMQQI